MTWMNYSCLGVGIMMILLGIVEFSKKTLLEEKRRAVFTEESIRVYAPKEALLTCIEGFGLIVIGLAVNSVVIPKGFDVVGWILLCGPAILGISWQRKYLVRK